MYISRIGTTWKSWMQSLFSLVCVDPSELENHNDSIVNIQSFLEYQDESVDYTKRMQTTSSKIPPTVPVSAF